MKKISPCVRGSVHRLRSTLSNGRSRTPGPRWRPVRPTHQLFSSRTDIESGWNQAGHGGEESARAQPPSSRGKTNPSRLDTDHPEGRQHRDQPWPKFVTRGILVTVWFRLESLSAPDFHDRLGLSVRLTTRTDALESPNIVWTSLMERPAVFNRFRVTGPRRSERNSTFKRAWISRLMYQKSFGGQLARVFWTSARIEHPRRSDQPTRTSRRFREECMPRNFRDLLPQTVQAVAVMSSGQTYEFAFRMAVPNSILAGVRRVPRNSRSAPLHVTASTLPLERVGRGESRRLRREVASIAFFPIL